MKDCESIPLSTFVELGSILASPFSSGATRVSREEEEGEVCESIPLSTFVGSLPFSSGTCPFCSLSIFSAACAITRVQLAL